MSENVYDATTPKGSLPENRFYFWVLIEGKKTKLSFPKMQWVDRRISKIFRKQGQAREDLIASGGKYLVADEVEEWVEIFSAYYPEHAEVFDALEDDQIMGISNAWLEATQADLPEEDVPESEASSDS